MKHIIYILILFIPLYFSSCEKDESGDEDGKEQPCENCEDPDPEEPEYDKETQVYINGIVWDKYSSIDYCTFNEAVDASEKVGKKMPTTNEWLSLNDLGYAWDSTNKGYWFGEDSELLDKSKKSIFLHSMGYLIEDDGDIIGFNNMGCFWAFGDRGANSHSVNTLYTSEKLYPISRNAFVSSSKKSAHFIASK